MSSPSEIWPNFFIVGAIKCGTTSLYEILKSHPQVFFAELKEPNYFLTVPPTDEQAKGRFREHCTGRPEAYLDLYRHSGAYPAIGDASAAYLWDENSARRIHEVVPDARIIILLREPVTRAHSHYLMNRKYGFEPIPTFHEAVQKYSVVKSKCAWESGMYIDCGRYYDGVKRYLDTFGPKNVLILLTDDLNKQPERTLSQVTRFLGIDPLPNDRVDMKVKYNSFAIPRFPAAYKFLRHNIFKPEVRQKYFPLALRRWLQNSPLLNSHDKPTIDKESRLFLQRIYGPEIVRLEELLGRKLPQLRKGWLSEPEVTPGTSGDLTREISETS